MTWDSLRFSPKHVFTVISAAVKNLCTFATSAEPTWERDNVWSLAASSSAAAKMLRTFPAVKCCFHWSACPRTFLLMVNTSALSCVRLAVLLKATLAPPTQYVGSQMETNSWTLWSLDFYCVFFFFESSLPTIVCNKGHLGKICAALNSQNALCNPPGSYLDVIKMRDELRKGFIYTQSDILSLFLN